ncbi:MAG: TonB-dependent receptor [Saprospirales bacterium]|nr:TonB-dependent receptor [Saprospirales bacterium]
MKKIIPTLSFFLLFSWLAEAQSPVQTIRGVVTDSDTGLPLPGAHITLVGADSTAAAADENGRFSCVAMPVGRYRLQVSYLGYDTLTIVELLLESGKEVVREVRLRERSQALQEVVVKAQGNSGADIHPVSVHTLTVEEQLRFPATYFDPARVAMSFPGVVGLSDGTNNISIRGNAPAALQWRLEGAEIVNPNHTANAGTFSDRPAQSGGGINILSAQLLGTSNFLNGAFPAEYGNALGGVFDMRLREGNDREHEFTVQAGLIGIDLAAEGPVLRGSKTGSAPSFLVNYRYSFTGLLNALGVDLGDEEISFQDLAFHLSLPTAKAGHFALFGMGGINSTRFQAPADTALIVEDKQRFDADFQSQMGAMGLSHVLTLGKRSVLRSAAVVSALEHDRSSDLVWRVPEKTPWESDLLRERKISLSSIYSTKIGARHRIKAGVQAMQEFARFSHVYNSNFGPSTFDGDQIGWLLQPFIDYHVHVSSRFEFTAGLRLSHFTGIPEEVSPEPRLSMRYSPAAGAHLSLSYGLHSQLPLPELYALGAGLARSHHLVAGYRQEIGRSMVFNAEIYYQRLFKVPVAEDPENGFSALNLFEVHRLGDRTLNDGGTGRNFGLDLSLQKFILDRYYFIAASSLYRSYFTASDGRELPTLFDGRSLFKLTGGREFSKTKNGKLLVRGLSAHLLWMPGFPVYPVDVQGSQAEGYTVYDQSHRISVQNSPYFRLDLRFYLKWNKAGRNSILFLDLQNATNRKNAAYLYADFVQEQVRLKYHLGLLPILGWRVEF